MGRRTASPSLDRQHGSSSVLRQPQSEHRSASTAVASSSPLPGKQASCPRPGPAVCILVSPPGPRLSSLLFCLVQPQGGRKSLSLCPCAIPGRAAFNGLLPSFSSIFSLSYHYLSKWPHCSGKTLPSDSCCFRPLCFRQQDWLYNQSEVGLLFFAQPVLPEPSVI